MDSRQTPWAWCGLVGGCLAVFLAMQKQKDVQEIPRLRANSNNLSTKVVSIESHSEKRKLVREKQVSEPSTQADDLRTIVESVDIMSQAHIMRGIQSLRSEDPRAVSLFFLEELRTIGTQDEYQRDRLVILANALQSQELIPFWKNLLWRETPRMDNEVKLHMVSHPTLASRSIDLEQLQAIRNLGLLASKHQEAKQILHETIVRADPDRIRIMHREQAYLALRESDPVAGFQALKKLNQDDPLKTRIQSLIGNISP